MRKDRRVRDISRVIILDILLIIAFGACIVITTLMYHKDNQDSAERYISDCAHVLEHRLSLTDYKNWDTTLSEFRSYYDMDAVVKDADGTVVYSFTCGNASAENVYTYKAAIENTNYTLTVMSDVNETLVTNGQAVSVSSNILVGSVFIVIILIVNSFVQGYRSQIIRLATIDELTGLPNRKSFIHHYEKMDKNGKLKNAVLFMIDIDKFKVINDTKGHAAGDMALSYVGSLLKDLEKDNCIVGRWGGDEFMGVFIAAEGENSRIKAQRKLNALIEEVRKEPIVDGIELTLSIGTMQIIEDTDLTRNMERADQALYESKNTGRARLTEYENLAKKNVEKTVLTAQPQKRRSPESAILAYRQAEAKMASRTEEKQTDSSLISFVIDGIVDAVNHMLPFAIGGGVLIAVAFLIDAASVDISSLEPSEMSSFGYITDLAASFKSLGDATFGFMYTVFAAFLAMYIGGYEAFVAGFMGGCMAGNGSAGFIGVFFAGITAGYGVKLIKNFNKEMPESLKLFAPIILYPVLSLILINILMLYLIEPASSAFNSALSDMLTAVQKAGNLPVSALAGAMMGCDMGGPVNKAAYYFGTSAIENKQYDIMAAVMISGMVPPCGIALSTLLFKNRYTPDEQRRGGVTLLMGLSFITEGAIPYLLSDVIRVMIASMAGGAVAGMLSESFGCTLMAPHGGIFVFLIVGKPFMYFLSLVIGSLVTAIILGIIKPVKNSTDKPQKKKFMKKSKKVASILTSVLMAFMLVACESGSNALTSSSSQRKDDGHYTFAFTCMDGSNPYFIAVHDEMKKLIKERGDKLVAFDPENDVAEQNKQIEEMLDDDIDGIFVNPVDDEKISSALEEIDEAKIPMIGFDTQVANMSYLASYVGSDNYNAGKVVGEDLAAKCPEGGSIIVLDALTTQSATDRVNGFLDAIEGTNFDIFAQSDCGGTKSIAKENTEKLLAIKKDVVAIFCENDPTALGALEAANEAGLTDCLIYGVDGSPEIKQQIASGTSLIEGTGAQSPIEIADKAVDVMYKVMAGENVESIYTVDTFLITADNVDKYGTDVWQ